VVKSTPLAIIQAFTAPWTIEIVQMVAFYNSSKDVKKQSDLNIVNISRSWFTNKLKMANTVIEHRVFQKKCMYVWRSNKFT
jgi:hypothetical protein